MTLTELIERAKVALSENGDIDVAIMQSSEESGFSDGETAEVKELQLTDGNGDSTEDKAKFFCITDDIG